MWFSVWSCRANEEFSVFHIKGRGLAEVAERGACEVAEYVLVIGHLHGQIVVRSSPGCPLGSVTLRTHWASDIRRFLRSSPTRRKQHDP